MTKVVIATVVACALVAGMPGESRGTTPPEAKCASLKQKAAAKKEASKLGCWSKAVTKSVPIDSACIAKAEVKFSVAFTKASVPPGCADPGNGLADPIAPIEGSVDACVAHVLTTLADVTDAQCSTAACSTAPCPDGGILDPTTCAACPTLPGCADLTVTGKCSGAKIKAASKSGSGELTCYSKAAAKVTGVDTACLAKASSKVSAAFAKADAKGACNGDPVGAQNAIDGACVTTIANQLPPKTPGCGNGVTEPGLGENCDDGDALDVNSCPHGCFINPCTHVAGTVSATVHYTPPGGVSIQGLTVFVDYPEGKVASLTVTHPFGVSGSPNDPGYGVTDPVVKSSGTLNNPFMTLSFNNRCSQDTSPVVAGNFSCTVLDASDTLGNSVDPSTVTCSVTVP